MTALRILAFVALAMAWLAGCWYLGGLVNRWFALSPTTPDEPGDDDREASGADPEFARELRAMKNATTRDDVGQELLANLRTSTLEEVAAHEKVASTIDALCDDLMAELDAICDKVLTAAKSCDRRHTRELNLDARGRAWLAAGLPGTTGEFAVVTA